MTALAGAVIRNVPDFVRIRSAPAPADGSRPREAIVDGIQDFLHEERARGTIGPEPVVGDSVASSVSAFRMLCGEHGAGDVDAELDVRQNPALKALLLRPGTNPEAQADFSAHELAAWGKIHAQNPTVATGIATGLSLADRVTLQSWAHKLNRLPRNREEIPDPSRRADTPPWM
ncbi:hypothetical protein LKL35_36770 [Streptomyces sp. ET3-23]|uniref:hypothetical protein n=1 Tax=Streptomyces sp. ET3-23 TaxID=2885643 RepID=UPI001D11AD60|nr:hypothetical protein [Streptomyces sp. ET3-23]MCC2280880.1 hypothetical protein [Streptomyces sp. ET3-23]